ncbi:lipopolysaccharide biosynthesis protein [Propionispora hippei]|nr:oligosaccharide flippase family protein [Propionispora hippei]
MKKIKIILSNKTSRQTTCLFISQILGLVFGFISNMILAKNMGAQQFGLYSFTVAVLSFCSIFFEFGYFASGSKLLAENQSKEKEDELIGALLVITALISIGYVITIIIISFIIDKVFEDKIGDILRALSIVSFSFILPFFFELVMKGCNRILTLSVFNVLWRFLFLFAVFVLYFINQLTPLWVSMMFSCTCLAAFLGCVLWKRPKFTNLIINFKKIHQENQCYGKHLYLGRIVDVAAYQIDKMLVSFFAGAKEVGIYSMAFSIANPVNSFSIALASSKFRDFAGSEEISRKVLNFNYYGIIISVIAAVSGGFIITHFYLGGDFKESFIVLLILVAAVSCQAGYKPYNSWLASNGHGVLQKKMAYQMTAVSLLSNILLTPIFGKYGAATACFISMLYAFYLYKVKYEKLIKRGI